MCNSWFTLANRWLLLLHCACGSGGLGWTPSSRIWARYWTAVTIPALVKHLQCDFSACHCEFKITWSGVWCRWLVWNRIKESYHYCIPQGLELCFVLICIYVYDLDLLQWIILVRLCLVSSETCNATCSLHLCANGESYPQLCKCWIIFYIIITQIPYYYYK